jgi:GTPase
MIDIREKPQMVQRAYLVGIQQAGESADDIRLLLDELAELVATLGIAIVGRECVVVRKPSPRLLLGSGKTAEILERAAALNADCMVLDTALSPSQQRNWEKLSGLCVIDRQEVILDIFSMRARTREAVLQVELARAEHSLPRLKNAWSHLSRQRGGGGVTQRGEGEAQIELDARMVRTRIARLRHELAAVVRHRQTQRKQRQRVPVPTAAIVGYTNAGKSTLLNRLTGSGVFVADQLFATLDPTTRQLLLDDGRKLLVTDTVGFVRRLPHTLVDAFKATLEEAVVADFIIHVLDATNPELEAHRATTLEVLAELGADRRPLLTVYNKIDALDAAYRQRLLADPATIAVSALTGEGFAALRQRLADMLDPELGCCELLIPHHRYDLVSQLHDQAAVESQASTDDGIRLRVRLPARLATKFSGFAIAADAATSQPPPLLQP